MSASRSDETTWKRLSVVLGVQGIVVTVAVGLAAAGLLIAGEAESLFPRVLRLPLQPVQPDTFESTASQLAVAEELSHTFPRANVSLSGTEITITFDEDGMDVRRALSVLGHHGFQTRKFILGRDFSPVSLANRLTGGVERLAIVVFSLPLVLLAAALLLRSRLVLPPRKRSPPIILGAGLAGGIALVIADELLELVASAMGHRIVEQQWIDTMIQSGTSPHVATFVFVAVVAAPLAEELFYRGWVFPYLRKIGAPLAYSASALLFALVHLHPPALPAYLLAGVGLAILYDWSGSIWTPVLAHSTSNLIAVVVLLGNR